MHKGNLLDGMKTFALKKDLNVTWNEVSEEFSEELKNTNSYRVRRLRVDFEGWITRMRQKPQSGE